MNGRIVGSPAAQQSPAAPVGPTGPSPRGAPSRCSSTRSPSTNARSGDGIVAALERSSIRRDGELPSLTGVSVRCSPSCSRPYRRSSRQPAVAEPSPCSSEPSRRRARRCGRSHTPPARPPGRRSRRAVDVAAEQTRRVLAPAQPPAQPSSRSLGVGWLADAAGALPPGCWGFRRRTGTSPSPPGVSETRSSRGHPGHGTPRPSDSTPANSTVERPSPGVSSDTPSTSGRSGRGLSEGVARVEGETTWGVSGL